MKIHYDMVIMHGVHMVEADCKYTSIYDIKFLILRLITIENTLQYG